MRVLQLHNHQLTRGGADIQMEREADGLRRRGHLVETMLVDNHQIAEIGRARAAAKALWNGEATRELKDRIRGFGPDVVHVQTPFPLLSPAVFVVAHRAGLPVVATSQSFRYSCVKATMLRDGQVCEDCVGRRLKYPALVHRCYQESLPGSLVLVSTLALHGGAGSFTRCVDCHIALTSFMRDRLVAEGISPERVVVIPHTPPDPGPPRPERDGYALFVGRLTEEKGVLTLLEAWATDGPGMPLVIVGDGPLRPAVDAAAARNPAVTVRGWIDSAEVAEVMARAEVLLMTSEWYEGFGVVITEAYAAGTPVIASDVGNFSEMVVPGVTGERYRSGDPADLARAVRWFVDQADRPALRRSARHTYLERFHPDRQLDALEDVYRDVIARHVSDRPAGSGTTGTT